MSKIKTQFGKSLTADFQENTWTFEMQKDYKVFAGYFAIVPKDDFLELLKAIKGISNSMNVHPDCTEYSEFEGMVQRCEDILSKVSIS